ncbi:hypothetical protein BST97_11225 [Nonlabens spongiae]|uniref:N-acetyltransferase domain-containing protein n=1 Tax=Nonlabens spongiae TaxID=331648 RepID=A0A1W6MLN0_9FLAO|nr:GNAT family N-acetyltransferase [Nonlabens spongiae]ARN78511.1 hypothetical protein BST97_11225 [Nonlabens spongiae]
MIQKLEWDSDFFGIDVANWQIPENAKLSSADIEFNLKSFDLIYLISSKPLEMLNKHLVDVKTTYTQKIDTNDLNKKNTGRQFIVFDKFNHNVDDLLKIVLESGEYSRFKRDDKFAKGKFESMYSQWMQNGIEERENSRIYVLLSDEKDIDGFIQIKVKPKKKVIIELIAVAPHARGQGVASRLLQNTIKLTQDKNLSSLEVVTQDQNIAATNLYVKNGFRLQKKEYIYHLWKS